MNARPDRLWGDYTTVLATPHRSARQLVEEAIARSVVSGEAVSITATNPELLGELHDFIAGEAGDGASMAYADKYWGCVEGKHDWTVFLPLDSRRKATPEPTPTAEATPMPGPISTHEQALDFLQDDGLHAFEYFGHAVKTLIISGAAESANVGGYVSARLIRTDEDELDWHVEQFTNSNVPIQVAVVPVDDGAEQWPGTLCTVVRAFLAQLEVMA